MATLYQCDLAYAHAAAFETIACGAAREIIRRLQSSGAPVRRVMDLGCGAGPLTKALVGAGFEVTGVDTSAELLELAGARVPAAHFVRASIYDPVPDSRPGALFDASAHPRLELRAHVMFRRLFGKAS